MPLIRNPSPQTIEVVDAFKDVRGGYLASFSQLEFAISRSISLMSASKAVSFGVDRLPQKSIKRADAFLRFFLETDELEQYKEQAKGIVLRFKKAVELRGFFAHGFARIDMDAETVLIRMFKERDGNSWNEDQIQLKFEEFNPITSQMSLLTQEGIDFIRMLSEQFDLGF